MLPLTRAASLAALAAITLSVACGGPPPAAAPAPAAPAVPVVPAAPAVPAVPAASSSFGAADPPAANLERPARSAAPTQSSDAPAPVPVAAVAADAGPPAVGAEPSTQTTAQVAGAVLPAGTTVLHIGDSFAGALGIDLNRELKAAGVRGILKYQTATYIPTWASSKDLDDYLQRYHPDLVLITLGANELEIPEPAQRAPTIQRLVGRLGGAPCVWVGPPLWQGARPALLETIRASCAPCLYLDSSALVPDLPRARDHIHPSMEGRRTWAKAVVGWLGQHRATSSARPWDLAP